uniref:Uncharacterized protein n=1 Tax=Anguilla anguilla TaxID=7936 RepID=A0A0E9W117_ANGAN
MSIGPTIALQCIEISAEYLAEICLANGNCSIRFVCFLFDDSAINSKQ